MTISRSTLENVIAVACIAILLIFAIAMIAFVMIMFWYGVPAV